MGLLLAIVFYFRLTYKTWEQEHKCNGICYLTHCKTTFDVNLLDLRAESVTEILHLLHENNINIFTSGFHKYCNGQVLPLSAIANSYDRYLALCELRQRTDTECIELLNKANEIVTFIEPKKGNESFRYLGQLITDFDNGPIFKELVKQRGYQGYLFFEHDKGTPKVTTYCFFEPTYLSIPICEKIVAKYD